MKLSTYLKKGLSESNINLPGIERAFKHTLQVFDQKYNIMDESNKNEHRAEILHVHEMLNKYRIVQAANSIALNTIKLSSNPNLKEGNSLYQNVNNLEKLLKGLFNKLEDLMDLYFFYNKYNEVDIELLKIYYHTISYENDKYEDFTMFLKDHSLLQQFKKLPKSLLSDPEKYAEAEILYYSNVLYALPMGNYDQIFTFIKKKLDVDPSLHPFTARDKLKELIKKQIAQDYNLKKYKDRLKIITDHHELFKRYNNHIKIAKTQYSLIPQSEEDKQLYVDWMWKFEKDQIYLMRLHQIKSPFTKIPIQSFAELKLKFYKSYHSSLSRPALIKKKIEFVKNLVQESNSTLEAFETHHDRRVADVSLMDVLQWDKDFKYRTIFFKIGTIIDEYVQFYIFLENFNEQQYIDEYFKINLENYCFDSIPLVGIPGTYAQKIKRSEFIVNLAWNGIIHKPISTDKEKLLNLLPENVSYDDFHIAFDILNCTKYFKGDILLNKDPEKNLTIETAVSKITEEVMLISNKELARNIINYIVYHNSNSYFNSPLHIPGKTFAKKLIEASGNFHLPESAQQLDKIKTTMNVDTLAAFIRVMKEAGLIESFSMGELAKLTAEYFVSRGRQANTANSIEKKFYPPTSKPFGEVLDCLHKMEEVAKNLKKNHKA